MAERYFNLPAHFWTVWPVLRETVGPRRQLPGEPVGFEIDDADLGRLELTGSLHAPAGRRRLLIVIHGLGGCAESHYMVETAAAHDQGFATLRLNQRGCDRGGADLYHAGLTSDLGQVLSSPLLARFEEIYLLGFSLGGHQVLKFATEAGDPRLRSVAAVCAPLDLERSVDAFDRPSRKPYRIYILRGLLDIYARIAERREMPATVDEIARASRLRQFDALTVVPRFGFADTADYYHRSSVGPRLGDLRVPALLVAAKSDPMVSAEAIAPFEGTAPGLEIRWIERGGHVSFPADLDLGYGPPLGLVGQICQWLGEAR